MRVFIIIVLVVIFGSSTTFAANSQERSKYARQYATYYERIQVGATAQASGKDRKTLHIQLKYNLDDFVVSVAMGHINEWKNLGFNKVIVSDQYKSWTHKIE
ncbi:hypothetical protein [Geobacter sp.]|uniref:hypothetical protein n=1 Tax=Geobacter sp. TaxID=46610 RepID=UPI001ACF8707|nr:hypothetical protein [Geobacter sp.]CAG1770700.1 hypothetical protein BAC3_01265 [uncultured bacterium]